MTTIYRPDDPDYYTARSRRYAGHHGRPHQQKINYSYGFEWSSCCCIEGERAAFHTGSKEGGGDADGVHDSYRGSENANGRSLISTEGRIEWDIHQSLSTDVEWQ